MVIQFLSFFSWLILFSGCDAQSSQTDTALNAEPTALFDTTIITGAEQLDKYLPFINNKYIAVVANQTSVVGHAHLIDTLIKLGVKIPVIFSPEHGIRGDADAGAHIENSKDEKTGIPIVSLYGNKKKPSAQDLQDIDIVLFDIQDVGVRFYTYISTLHYVMEACAENKKKLIVLDRPNPNGFYISGPVLKKEFNSFVGMHPVPIVYGMTIGEYAKMINGEGWLPEHEQCDLTVIPNDNYDHHDYYELKIAPSPNLRSMRSIYLYPSLCLFEGANVSVGRGTNSPFEIFGSPSIKEQTFSFIPKSTIGAKSPPFINKTCYGFDLQDISIEDIRKNKLNIAYLIEAYENFEPKKDFFLSNNFFEKLAGTDELELQLKAGLTKEQINLSWQNDISEFKQIRKKYLLYPDFE